MNNDNKSMDKEDFGMRGGPVITRSDVGAYNILYKEIKLVLLKYKAKLTYPLPEKDMRFPIPGEDSDERGWKLLDYSLKLTWIALEIANFLRKTIHIEYEIKEVQAANGLAMMIKFNYGKNNTTSYHNTYVEALTALLKNIRESVYGK